MVIYKITNKYNGKIYIGQTTQYSTRRLVNHKYLLRKNKHFNSHLQRAWNKYGENAFAFEFIDKASTLQELNKKEQIWISYYNSINPDLGYNADLGGKNGRMTEGNKEKLRQRMIGNTYTKGHKLSPERPRNLVIAPKQLELSVKESKNR